MLELGHKTSSEHKKLGLFINNLNIDIVLAFGSSIKKTFSNLNDNFIYKKYFNKIEALKKIFDELVEKNDLVYLKGSRSIKLERIYK